MDGIAIVGIGIPVLIAAGVYVQRSLRRRQLLKKAQMLLEWGDFPGAASLYEDAGDTLNAAEAHAKGGDRLRAARLFVALGDLDAAAHAIEVARGETLDKGVTFLEAAGVFEERTRVVALAGAARAAGEDLVAARLFAKLGDKEAARSLRLKAARAFHDGGKFLEAADLFEAERQPKLAAAALGEAIRKEAAHDRRRALSDRAAALLLRVRDLSGAAQAHASGGDVEQGIQVLLDGGDTQGAAQLMLRYGQNTRAAEHFEKTGDLDRASRAFVRAGNLRKAAELRERFGDTVGAAKLLLDAKEPAAAAQVHLRAGAKNAAAEILGGAGLVQEAVDVYSAAGDIDAAVGLLCKVGKVREAAAILQEKGEQHRAKVLLAHAGLLPRLTPTPAPTPPGRTPVPPPPRADAEGAAQTLLDLGRPHEARETLSKTQSLTPRGRFLMARACFESGHLEDAVANLEPLLADPPRGLTRASVLYVLGQVLEKLGRKEEAAARLQELVAHDPSFRDAAFKLRLLKEALAVVTQKSEPISPMVSETVELPPATARRSPTALPPEWGADTAPLAVDGLNDWASQVMSSVPPSADEQRRRRNLEDDSCLPARYAVEKELGRGGMGVVYRAVDTQLGRTVAIKVLKTKSGADPRIREYFLREARAVAQLIHPNIVTLFDAGLEGVSPYLVMELVEGRDLRHRLDQGPISLAEALPIVAAVASALDYAHTHGIVHRDVKPENILLGAESVPKLMDFGVAHVMKETAEAHATIVGTPVYMSPEQVKGEAVGHWTDTYSLGIVLFECLTGQLPFSAEGALWHHVNTPPPDPRTRRGDISPGLAEVVLRCLAKERQQRPASAKALADELLTHARAETA
jgi:tetratricopeptide (TPR) repeat protein/predicted Ser/Thr protein kinase